MSGEPTAIMIGEAAPAEVVPVLWDGPDLDLPDNAMLHEDGSVTVTLAYPFELSYRTAGSSQVTKSEPVEAVTLHRLTGADVRKLRQARDPARAAIIASARVSAARFELWTKQMDATDETTLGAVVTALMDVGGSGLPAQAEDQGDAVELRLLFPRDDAAGTGWDTLRFKRMTAAQRRQMGDAEDSLVWAVSHATGLTPKLARPLLDSMDGADVSAIAAVIHFLGRSGRPTGG